MLPLQVQVHLYTQLAAEFCVGSLGTSGLVLRDLAGVEQLLFSLREYYSVLGGRERETIVEVRSYLLLIVKQFITTVSRLNYRGHGFNSYPSLSLQDKGIREEELQSILHYLSTVPEVNVSKRR